MPHRILTLVRHAQTDLHDDIPDRLGFGLTALGEQQARLTAERLSVLPIRAIHHSSLRRAAETARILASRFPGVPLRPSRLLWECIPCIPTWGGEFFAEVPGETLARHHRQAELAFAKFIHPALGLGQAPAPEFSGAGGLTARPAYMPRGIPHTGEPRHEVIVCHGNLLRYFVLRALGAPPELWTNTDTFNCCISQVTIERDGRLVLLSHNDIGHIPWGMRTF